MDFLLYLIYDASVYGYTTTTGTTVGALASGTKLYPEDKLNDIIKRMVGGTTYKYIINNTNDTDTFCSKYNHDNNYNGLNIGDAIRINDGKHNAIWKVAGFDCEYNRTASDGTVYNNGYGICLIPNGYIDSGFTRWNSTDTLAGGYKSSTMHTSHLVTVANNLKNVLGNHLVLRNVLLSSAYDPNAAHSSGSHKGASSNYTWTTSYATLMSAGQCTGTFGQHRNQYDDGEANYKLPLFDYEEYKIGQRYWLRNVWGFSGNDEHCAWLINSSGGYTYEGVDYPLFLRPLIYLR